MQIRFTILLFINALPTLASAQKLSSNKKIEVLNKPKGAIGPCFADRTCNNGLICDRFDLFCKQKSDLFEKKKKFSRFAATAASLKRRKRREIGYRCSNGLQPSSQCFSDRSCGYSSKYQCNVGPGMMNFCCPTTTAGGGTVGGTNTNQQQQVPTVVKWPMVNNFGIGGVGGGGCIPNGNGWQANCQPNNAGGGGYGCYGGCQIQPQQVQTMPQVITQSQQQPYVITQQNCPPSYQDIGQCIFSLGPSCSTSGNGQCFNSRCCEPNNPTPNTATTTNGCMLYVPQFQKSFDICPGNTKCVNGQCVAEQTTSSPNQPCIPVPCSNVYNQQWCCWGRKK